MFMRCVLLLTFLLSYALSFPLALRDVVDPPITSPTANTVWYIGQTQTVTWNTAGLPLNQTNPVGKLVLGFMYNNSENLMLDSPLAINLNYSVGQAQITVPNVPNRTDYIVVLFGDSGNASPEFTIINSASSPVSAPPSSISPSPSLPPPSSSISPFLTAFTQTPPSSTTSLPSSGATSSTVTTSPKTSSTLPATQSSAASQKHVPGLTSLSVELAIVYLAFS